MYFYLLSLPDFTYNGQLKIIEFYRGKNAKAETHALHWTKELFEILQNVYDKGELQGPYGTENVENIKYKFVLFCFISDLVSPFEHDTRIQMMNIEESRSLHYKMTT